MCDDKRVSSRSPSTGTHLDVWTTRMDDQASMGGDLDEIRVAIGMRSYKFNGSFPIWERIHFMISSAALQLVVEKVIPSHEILGSLIGGVVAGWMETCSSD